MGLQSGLNSKRITEGFPGCVVTAFVTRSHATYWTKYKERHVGASVECLSTCKVEGESMFDVTQTGIQKQVTR